MTADRDYALIDHTSRKHGHTSTSDERTRVVYSHTCAVIEHMSVSDEHTSEIAEHTSVIAFRVDASRTHAFRLTNQRFPSLVTEMPVDLPSVRRNITRTVFTKFRERVLKPPARRAAAISLEFFGVSTVER